MRRLNVRAFPCCPVSTQPFRDLLLMWKLAQPQCSFILDFSFVNTSYVVGDMTWTSYLSPSPSSNYWEPHFISVRLLYSSQTQYLLFSYCWWGLESAGKPESRSFPTSPLQEPSGCAVLHSNPGWDQEHQVLWHLCRYSNRAAWVSRAQKASQEQSPEVLVLMLCCAMCL